MVSENPTTAGALKMVCDECGLQASSIEFGMDFGSFVAPCGHTAGVRFVPIES